MGGGKTTIALVFSTRRMWKGCGKSAGRRSDAPYRSKMSNVSLGRMAISLVLGPLQSSADEQGRIDRWYAAAFDIEERKRAEAQVEQAYLRLAEAQRLSMTGSFITDLLVDDHNWSEELYRIFEFDPATRITHAERFGRSSTLRICQYTKPRSSTPSTGWTDLENVPHHHPARACEACPCRCPRNGDGSRSPRVHRRGSGHNRKQNSPRRP